MEELYVANGSSVFFSQMWGEPHENVVRPHISWMSPEDVPLKIGISGAQGVGKNKLANELAAQLELPIVQRVPRTVKSLGLPLNQKAKMDTNLAIWMALVSEQVVLPEYVADTTLIECLAHASVMVDAGDNDVDLHMLTALQNLTASLYNSQYTIVFYLPPRGKIEANTFRSRNKQYQLDVDEYVRYYLDCFSVDYFPLVGDNSLQLALDYLADAGLLDQRS